MRSKRWCRSSPNATPTRCRRCPSTGAATGWFQRSGSSGSTARTACTTGSVTGPLLAATGASSASLRKASVNRVDAAVHGRQTRQLTRLRRIPRSEEHTSELQSHSDLVCRLLLEKKKKNINIPPKENETRLDTRVP